MASPDAPFTKSQLVHRSAVSSHEPTIRQYKTPLAILFHSCPARAIVLSRSHCTRETKKTASSFQRYSHSSPPLPLHDSDLHYPPPFPHRSRPSLLIFSKSYCPPHLYRTMPAQRTRDTPTYCASSSLTTIPARILTLDIPQHSK